MRCKEMRANCVLCLGTNICVLPGGEDPAVMTPSKAQPHCQDRQHAAAARDDHQRDDDSSDHCALLRSAISVIQPRNPGRRGLNLTQLHSAHSVSEGLRR